MPKSPTGSAKKPGPPEALLVTRVAQPDTKRIPGVLAEVELQECRDRIEELERELAKAKTRLEEQTQYNHKLLRSNMEERTDYERAKREFEAESVRLKQEVEAAHDLSSALTFILCSKPNGGPALARFTELQKALNECLPRLAQLSTR